MSVSEELKEFKNNESPESIVVLIDSTELRSGVVAWKSVLIKFKDCKEVVPVGSEVERWEWLWRQVEFDLNVFGVVAGIPPQNTQRIFTRLKGLRLIYPDGTVNLYATKYLQSIILSKLPKQKKTS